MLIFNFGIWKLLNFILGNFDLLKLNIFLSFCCIFSFFPDSNNFTSLLFLNILINLPKTLAPKYFSWFATLFIYLNFSFNVAPFWNIIPFVLYINSISNLSSDFLLNTICLFWYSCSVSLLFLLRFLVAIFRYLSA